MATPYYNAASQPVIVQGQNIITNASEWNKGERQPNRCRDAFWGFLFYVHLGLVGFATVTYAPTMAEDMQDRRLLSTSSRWMQEEGEDVDVDMNSILTILAVCGLASFVISSLAMAFMMYFAQGVIKIALFFNLIVTGGLAFLAFSSGALQLAIPAVIGFIFSMYYTCVVWKRIPFAASNLVTAITAVRANIGLAFFAYTNLFVSFLWSVWWAIAFAATNYVLSDCDAEWNCENEVNGFFIFLFLVSYFWTAQVVKNVVHVTVAGTVGTWWFVPGEARTCCSRGVRDSYVRSITTSFGSICLGVRLAACILV